MANYIANDGLKRFLGRIGIKSQAGYIQANGWGYGQVEPNHMAAQGTKETYAQLPAQKDITILENGQFVKYDLENNCVDFTGDGEWLMVWNEIKLYRDGQSDAEFAMLADNYQARVYSPFGHGDQVDDTWDRQSRFYNGVDADGNTKQTINGTDYPYDDVTAAADPYEMHSVDDPFHIVGTYKEKMMNELGDVNSMVPRVMRTTLYDTFTTNMIADESVEKGDILSPRTADGILSKSGDGSIQFKVVKLYTMPDHQPGVKLQRIK